MIMARRNSALLAVALVCCVAPNAHAGLVKVIATNCSGFAEAQTALKQAYETAKTSAPITLKLELACTGSFVCTDPADLFDLNLANATTANGKQPSIVIDISANPKCKRGGSRPLIDGLALDSLATIFRVNSENYPNTPLTFTLSSVRGLGADNNLINVNGGYSIRTIVNVKDVDSTGFRIWGRGETFQMTGGSVLNVTNGRAFVASVTKLAKLERALIADNAGAVRMDNDVAAGASLPSSTSVQFLVIGNTFNTNGVTDATAAVTAAFSSNGTISLTLRGNQFIGNAAASVQNETVCVSNSAVARRTPRLSLAGNQGVEPSKPARNVVPWPASSACNLAFLTQV